MSLIWDGKAEERIELIRGERRSNRRYETELDLQYELLEGGRVVRRGAGTTSDLSSGGLSFRTDDVLPAGRKVRLSISWPSILPNVAPVELAVGGRVIRSHGQCTAVQADSYEFRSCGVSALARAAGDLFLM